MIGTKRKMNMQRGVTLIELMIAMVIGIILVGGIYSLFISQQQTYTVQDRVVGMQQDARAALMIMAKEIRLAGFLTGSTGFNIGPFPDAVNRQNNISSGTDGITICYATERVSQVTISNGKLVTLSSGGSSFDRVNNRFVAFDRDPHVYQIDPSDTDGDNILTLTDPPSAGDALDDIGASVYHVQAITYRVINNSLQRINWNTGDSQPLAGDGVNTVVEDLQFAYQVAGSTDWIFDNDTPAWPAGTGAPTAADIRMVRISIVVRTAVPDPEDTSFSRPVCEDHPGDNLFPGCRRRVYTTVVKLRNLDM